MFPKFFLSVFLTLAFGLFASLSSAQTITDSLPPFQKVQVSPLVNLVLEQGEREHIRIEYEGISPEKINFSVKGKKLRIYLDDAKYTVKTEEVIKDGFTQNVPIYIGVKITAYVTYKSLNTIQLRGEEIVSCQDSLVSRRFKIQLFGVSKVDLAYVQCRRLKIHVFGENEVKIQAGDTGIQKCRLFGDNKIHTGNMVADRIKASSFGESSLALFATEDISLWGIGEVHMSYGGDPDFKKRMIGVLSTTSW